MTAITCYMCIYFYIGTHTIAQVQLDPDGNQFKASYVPVEAGPFYVTILWNGQQIPSKSIWLLYIYSSLGLYHNHVFDNHNDNE